MPAFYGREIASRLLLGTAQYPSPAVLAEAFRRSGAGVATVSVRREAGGGQAGQDCSTKRRILMSLAVKTVDAGYLRY